MIKKKNPILPEIIFIKTELSINPVNPEVIGLEYGIENGIIINYQVNPNKRLEIHFNPHVVGFRVLDEGDLLEFWTQKEYVGTGIYEVVRGGWKTLEETRSGFLTGFMNIECNEYLITGDNYCVSVIAESHNKPVILSPSEN